MRTPASLSPPPKIGERILGPWQSAFSLLQSNPSFFRMQCGFMFGGIGLMLTAPSLPLFCVDVLSLSHSEITTARSILMGLGVAISSYSCKKMIAQVKTDLLLRNVLIGFSLYLLLLYFSKLSLFFFYFSFILYGLSQAGSHLLWNLSGPIFSGQEESSQFSRVNILMVGLRGSITPAMGGILCKLMGPSFVILCGILICLSGAFYVILTKPFMKRAEGA
jgi:predicted MFS family arabinose efflux permease